jgi:excisionase family DNA binding protein
MIDSPASYDSDDPLLTPQVVAKRLHKHPETVYRWMRSGFIDFVRDGPRRKMIPESEVLRLRVPRGT